MHPKVFFHLDQIIRPNEFKSTFAVGHELPSSIAYANDMHSLRRLNKISSIASIITTKDFVEEINVSKGVIVSENPQKDFYNVHNFMVQEGVLSPLNESRIDSTAQIASTAIIGDHVSIGRNVNIGDYVVILSNTIIEDDCEIDSFVVLGAKGMHKTMIDGTLFHLEYAGGVKIGKRSRILTGAIIQKPYQSFYTSIGNDCVVSTKVVIGHGSKVGNNTLLSGNSAIAGNCSIGNDVWIGGGAIVSDGISIGNQAQVKTGSVVVKDVLPKDIVSGNFAFNHKQNLKYQMSIRR